MFDLFSLGGNIPKWRFFHSGWDIFLREGMKPSPAQGKCVARVGVGFIPTLPTADEEQKTHRS